MGLPVLQRSSSFRHALATTPAKQHGCTYRSLARTMTAFPQLPQGRLSHLHFRGLLSVHSRWACLLAESPKVTSLHRRLQPLRYLHDCSDCYRPERQLPGGVRTHWKTVPSHGAR